MRAVACHGRSGGIGLEVVLPPAMEFEIAQWNSTWRFLIRWDYRRARQQGRGGHVRSLVLLGPSGMGLPGVPGPRC